VAILRRGRKQRRGAGKRRRGTAEDTAHLERFIATRSGVEAFVEPQTTITDTTVLLVASDGEWTRRRVDGPAGARRSPSAHRSRCTTWAWSATRNGCGLERPAQGGGCG
jgi:hypothetical protein